MRLERITTLKCTVRVRTRPVAGAAPRRDASLPLPPWATSEFPGPLIEKQERPLGRGRPACYFQAKECSKWSYVMLNPPSFKGSQAPEASFVNNTCSFDLRPLLLEPHAPSWDPEVEDRSMQEVLQIGTTKRICLI